MKDVRTEFLEIIQEFKNYLLKEKTFSLKVDKSIENYPITSNITQEIRPSELLKTPKDIKPEIDNLKKIVLNCEKCQELANTRKTVVFGEGNIQSKVLIIGEAPGEEEDRQGKPFVGKSGELLTKMLAGINIDRKDVFITNILKCRPPGNRSPHKQEISNCTPYLEKQLEFMNPRFILTLGKFSSNYMLGTDSPISQLRKQKYIIKNRCVIPTYHPSYILHSQNDEELKKRKQEVWENLKMLRTLIQDLDKPKYE